MVPSTLTCAVAALSLISLTAALPAPAPAATPAVTCKAKLLNFDDLPSTSGDSKPLPKAGYDYNGLELRENGWNYVSKGIQYNGDFTANDRAVPQPFNEQQSNITPHSGTNALMTVDDGWNYYIDAANYAGGHRFYDLKSLWVAPEYEGKAWSFRMQCQANNVKEDKDKTWQIPAMAAGQYYKITLPDWVHMYRCRIGSVSEQQVIIDDLEYCLWDFPYAVPIPF